MDDAPSSSIVFQPVKMDEQHGKVREVDLRKVDRSLKLRHCNMAAVADFATRYKQELPMDPITLFEVNGKLIVGDGDARIDALLKILRRRKAPCRVIRGTQIDAVQFWFNANSKHVGQRLSRSDREKAVKTVMKRWPEWSDNALALITGTSDRTIGRYRNDLEATGELRKLDTRLGMDGIERPARMTPRGESTDSLCNVNKVVSADAETTTPPQVAPGTLCNVNKVQSGSATPRNDHPDTGGEPLPQDQAVTTDEPRHVIPMVVPLAQKLLVAQMQLSRLLKAVAELKIEDTTRYERYIDALTMIDADLKAWSEAA